MNNYTQCQYEMECQCYINYLHRAAAYIESAVKERLSKTIFELPLHAPILEPYYDVRKCILFIQKNISKEVKLTVLSKLKVLHPGNILLFEWKSFYNAKSSSKISKSSNSSNSSNSNVSNSVNVNVNNVSENDDDIIQRRQQDILQNLRRRH